MDKRIVAKDDKCQFWESIREVAATYVPFILLISYDNVGVIILV